MPSESLSIPPLPFLVAAVAMLALLAWIGVFSPHAFRHAPDRRIGLGLMDVFVGVAVTLGGMSLYTFIAPLLPADPSAADAPPLTRIMSVLIAQLCTQMPPVIYLVARAATAAPRGLATLGILPKRPARETLIGLGAIVCVLPVVLGVQMAASALFTWLGHPPPPLAHDLLPLVIDERSGPAVFLLLALAVIVLAPILEEGIFRGLLQSSLVEAMDGRRWPAILVTASVFTLIHQGTSDPQALPGLFVLSLAFGWIYERTGSLWPGILLHALFNGLNLVLVALLF